MRLLWIFALFGCVTDQASKWYVISYLNLAEVLRIDVYPPYLTFRMGWNPGINFGLGAGFDARWYLVGVALAISLAVVIWMWREQPGRWGMASAGLLVGGALGNVIDRVRFEQGVQDFLNMSCCGIQNPYAFNVADIWVFAGALGLVLFTGDRKKKT